MKHFLFALATCALLACHGSDKLSQKEQEYEKKRIVRNQLALSKGTQLLSLVKQHAFLRAPRVIGNSVIVTCIRNDGSLESPYPTQEVQALLETGVDIDQEETGGRTALHEFAVGMNMFSRSIIKGLLKHKADPAKQDRQGYNALGIALMSNRCDKSVFMLARNPKIAAIVNQPMLLHAQWTTPLNALITTDNTSCIYRKNAIENILDAGAQIAVKDICDSLEPDRAYKTILKRCSLTQMAAALLLVEHHRYDSPLIKFSKKRELCKAMKEKKNTEFSCLVMPGLDKMLQAAQENKQPPSYAEAMQQQELAPNSPRSLASIQEQSITPKQSLQPGYMRSVLTEYFKGNIY